MGRAGVASVGMASQTMRPRMFEGSSCETPGSNGGEGLPNWPVALVLSVGFSAAPPPHPRRAASMVATSISHRHHRVERTLRLVAARGERIDERARR